MKKSEMYDKLTVAINGLLSRLPYLGKYASRLYLWKPQMFNFMCVGASGTVLSYVLYEGILRRLLVAYPGGTFLGMVITTIIVFLWNFTWNKRWSLKPSSQILNMPKDQLAELRSKIDKILEA